MWRNFLPFDKKRGKALLPKLDKSKILKLAQSLSKSCYFGSSPCFTLKQLNYHLLAQFDGLEVCRETTEGSNTFIGAAFVTGKTRTR